MALGHTSSWHLKFFPASLCEKFGVNKLSGDSYAIVASGELLREIRREYTIPKNTPYLNYESKSRSDSIKFRLISDKFWVGFSIGNKSAQRRNLFESLTLKTFGLAFSSVEFVCLFVCLFVSLFKKWEYLGRYVLKFFLDWFSKIEDSLGAVLRAMLAPAADHVCARLLQ